jgi:hypothetical protein
MLAAGGGVMRGHFIFVPIDVATKPAEGHAYADRWWSVHPNLGVAFYVAPNTGRGQGYEPSPQCNADERTAPLSRPPVLAAGRGVDSDHCLTDDEGRIQDVTD